MGPVIKKTLKDAESKPAQAYKTVVPKVDRRKAMQWDGTFQKALEIARMLGDPCKVSLDKDAVGKGMVCIAYTGIRDRGDPLGQYPRDIALYKDDWVTIDSYRQVTVIPSEEFWVDWEEEKV